MQTAVPTYKDLILVGGGHSHALVLKMWAMKPIPGVRLSLVSPQVLTPYSGMLPGLIAGHYRFDETHIDLAKLCRFANARFIQAAITEIDLVAKELCFDGRVPLGFDVLSINTGIGPDLRVPGAQTFSTPVKPIAKFYPRWIALRDALAEDKSKEPYRIAIVGGGAAGLELILAMHFALVNDVRIKRPLQFSLIQQGEGLPEGHPKAIHAKVAKILAKTHIAVFPHCRVKQVRDNCVETEKGQSIPFDSLFWCTNARAAAWPSLSALKTDDGFIAVNQYLQSPSHDFVFATGDIARQEGSLRPRAGVFAVRQGPALFNNLRRALLKQRLKAFKPQSNFLSLLACGEQYALACKPGVLPSFGGAWVWRWKERIDRKFMAMFSDLLPLPMASEKKGLSVPDAIRADSQEEHEELGQITEPLMRCGGCGAKVGASVLTRVMARIKPVDHEGVILGLKAGDDASAIRIPPNDLLVQSVDVLKALVDDPYVMGQISAEHALSDLFAMHAVPHSALAIATLPYGSEAVVERDLLQIMQGAVSVLNQHGCALTGGHTSEGAELSLGFTVNGTCPPDQLLRKSQPKLGHCLILTQALGTGTLFAAHAQLRAKGEWLSLAVDGMLLSNRDAGEIFHRYQASACTDITGFGLLGHLLEMLKPSGCSASINLAALPALTGALSCLEQGIASSLQPQNLRLRYGLENPNTFEKDSRYALLFDPQTSGGLLASVPEGDVEHCLAALHKAGYKVACVIGTIQESLISDEALITDKPLISDEALKEHGRGKIVLKDDAL